MATRYYNRHTTVFVYSICRKANRDYNFLFVHGRRFGGGIYISSRFLIKHRLHTPGGWRNTRTIRKIKTQTRKFICC